MSAFNSKKLRQFREEKNLSREDLAFLIKNNGLKINQATIGNWENGETFPDANYLAAISMILNKPVSLFFN